MQHSAHNGSVKREERVPLAALVELRGVEVRDDESEPPVEADGLNVSIGGIAMRASQAPRLGQLVTCRFSCPPTGELVRAQGQVVWSEQTTPEGGAFGLRFVELDTKSATALRRLVSPGAVSEPKADKPRRAVLSIDGLGMSIDAGLKLADDSRLVLEHKLSFLQLGRSVEVTVPGRGKERGRIASVELRQSQYDAPTLVYGVLLDGAPGREVEATEPGTAALFTATDSSSLAPLQARFDAAVARSEARLDDGGEARSVEPAGGEQQAAKSDETEYDIDESALLADALENALGPDVAGTDSPSARFDMHDEIDRFSELPSDVMDDELSHEPSSYYYSRVVAPAVREKERSSRIPPPGVVTSETVAAAADETPPAAGELNSVDTHPGIGPAAALFAPVQPVGGNTRADVPTALSASAAAAPLASAASSRSPVPKLSSASASSSVRTLQANYTLPPPAASAVAARRPTRNTRLELAEAALAHGEAGSSTDIDGRTAFHEDLGPDDDEGEVAQVASSPARYVPRANPNRRANMSIEDNVYDRDDDFYDQDDELEQGLHAAEASASDEDDDAPLELQPTPGESDAAVGLPALQVRTLPAHLRSLFSVPVARFHKLRLRIEPALRQQTEFLDLPEARSRLLLHLARGRAAVLRGWSGIRKSTATVRSRKSRPMRLQRATLPGVGVPVEVEAPRPPQTARIAALALALVGVGLGVYALAPRSGADRIRIPERVEAVATVAEPTIELHDEGDPLDEPVVTPAPKPRNKRGKAREVTPPVGLDEAAAVAAPVAPTGSVVSAPFGEADVPNGRVFTLRMNGAVEQVEGEARENGFTVRVPGRLALDRASPIATSHSAVSRAMILNRGGYAELTVDFLPGLSPRYQVRGRDNTLEVTLERL
ncbi:MAG: hypothetical protein RLZZ450_6713 [Pseudomonadota bacterium]